MDFFQKLFGIALKYAQQFATKAGQVASKAMPGELIYLVELTSDSQEYEINLADEKGGTAIPIEHRLAFRNNFVVSGMALGVVKVPVAGNNTYWGASHPVFHEDANVFNAPIGTAALTESQAVACIWNGHMSFEGNEELKISKMPLRAFRTVHTTQVGGTSNGTTGFATVNEQNGSEYKSLGGIMKIGGGNENKLVINFYCKDKTHLPGTDTGKNYLYVALRGAYVRGGTISELQG